MDPNPVLSAPLFGFLGVSAAALFSFVAVAVWSDARRREREAYYRSETVKKLAETQGAAFAMDYLREEETRSASRLKEGLRLGGVITSALGASVMVFLAATSPNEPGYLLGLIPLSVGLALLAYVYLLAPRA